LVLPEGYYASPKRIVKALEAMKHQKGMKKGFSLGMSEVDHKATLWVSESVLVPEGSTVCGRRRESSFLRLFLPPVRFSTVVLEHLLPSSVRPGEKHILVLPEGYYASPKRIVKALETMKHQKGMKKGFSLGMSEVDHKATLWVRDLSQVIISPCHHFSVSSCHRYDSQQWYLSISYHPRFDQGAIHVQRIYPEGYYASPKRIVKALEAMKHQKGMKKGFSLGMSEVDHKATLWGKIVHGTVTG
jgi:biotin synthase-like enzyme